MPSGLDILSVDLQNFISKHIDSVASLELLLFFRKHRDRSWTVEQLNAELKSNVAAVQTRAESLLKKGLLKRPSPDTGYQYAPANPELDGYVERISQVFSKYQMRIIDIIYSPKHRALQEFANAFKLNREDDDG